MRTVHSYIIFIVFFVCFAQSSTLDTIADPKDTWVDLPELKLRNPYVAGAASMLVPGAGQIYTHKYLMAGIVLASEGIAVSSAVFWFDETERRKGRVSFFDDSAAGLQLRNDTILIRSIDVLRTKAGLERFSSYESQFKAYNAISWAAGIYLFNVLDAVGGSNVFRNYGERSPSTAGLLAAVPALGLGQLYNGSLSKAGMVIMTQTSLGMVAWNYNRLMKRAEDQIKIIDDTLRTSTKIRTEYADDWRFRRDAAFRNRNTFMWYSLFFYAYSIFDAVVDANLHDYPTKMNIKPDLVPFKDGAQVSVSLEY